MELFGEKWNQTKDILLEDLSGSKKEITAAGLEETRKELIKKGVLTEDATAGSTQAGNIGDFRNIILPLVRRVLPNQIASELVGVQPMSGPVGLVYSLRFRYQTAQEGGTSLKELHGTDQDVVAGDEMFGNSKLAVHYSGDPDANDTFGGGFNVLDGEGIQGNKVDLQVVKQAVEADTRKLSARWTPEAAQDVDSQHGLDVKSELISAVSAEIIGEMDQEIILDLANLAGTTRAFDQDATTGSPGFVGHQHAALGSILAEVSSEIARKTRKGGANWIVASSPVVAALQSANRHVHYRGAYMNLEDGEGMQSGVNNNIKYVGSLVGGVKVYHDSFNIAGNDTIVVGYKGPTEVDAGYFHCPYIPLMASNVVTDPNTFEPSIQLMTRYGKTTFTNTATSLGNSADYYSKVTVENLAFL